jgi:glucose-1-phosphate thymidylyltransferase
MLANITEIIIISDMHNINLYKSLLGNGSDLGLTIDYAIQESPKGIPDAFKVSEKFIKGEKVCLILGDNIFYGPNFSQTLAEILESNHGAIIFGYPVKDPSRFGVAEFDHKNNLVSIKEKPKKPKSNVAITGLYFYDESVLDKVNLLKPSDRGELEISDLNELYIKEKRIKCINLGRGFAWLDSGTPDSLLDASHFIQTIEKRQGFKIACLEEIAFNNGLIDESKIKHKIQKYGQSSDYSIYLKGLIKNG